MRKILDRKSFKFFQKSVQEKLFFQKLKLNGWSKQTEKHSFQVVLLKSYKQVQNSLNTTI